MVVTSPLINPVVTTASSPLGSDIGESARIRDLQPEECPSMGLRDSGRLQRNGWCNIMESMKRDFFSLKELDFRYNHRDRDFFDELVRVGAGYCSVACAEQSPRIIHPAPNDVHSLYEAYVSSHWDDFDQYVMGNQYVFKWEWSENNGASDSTKAVATSSHRFVDTLFTKIYKNRQGFWNEDEWTREITRVCFLAASKYTNGMVDAIMLKTMPGCTNLPTDPDYDMDIEDLNGNQDIDFDDVILYFNYLEWIETNEPIVPFDYNNNGRIDFDDLFILYNEV